MKYTTRVGKRKLDIEDNIIDRIVNFIDPVRGVRRLQSRYALALSGMYFGASNSRRALSEWKPNDADPDATIQYDLSNLRQRSRDMIRNTPIATGAINTVCSNVVGSGLQLQSHIDRNILNLSDEKAEAWQSKTEWEWSIFWDSNDTDVSRILNGHGLTELAFRQVLENGEVFIILPRFKRGDMPYSLKLQLVEADRVCNANNVPDSDSLFMGIKKDSNGAPIEYHICNQFPYTTLPQKEMKWQIIPAYSAKTGLKNIIHLYKPLRPGQTRGIPYLTPVIEPLKQLGRYTESELMASVISSMLTVFIKTESGESMFDTDELGVETGAKADDKDIKLAPGAIIDLAKGEDITTVNPMRPNATFDPFVQSVLRQIGVALELPFEILIKHFTASYSAARAAMLEAWKFFNSRRQWLAQNFCQQVYEIWLYEAVALGRISAPGFFTSPLIRKAYSSAEWIGPAPGQIDPVRDVEAAEKRLSLGLTTRAHETSALGGDWDANVSQIKKERKQMLEIGLIQEEKTIKGVDKNENN
jgi:lambda family phage portal protein